MVNDSSRLFIYIIMPKKNRKKKVIGCYNIDKDLTNH